MAYESHLKFAGLHTANNETSLPDGALVQADNCVIRNRDVIEPRRGYSSTFSFGGGSWMADAMFFFGGQPIFLAHDTVFPSNPATLFHWTGTGNATNYSGNYDAPDSSLLRMKATEAQNNFYFNSKKGVYRLDSVTGTPRLLNGLRPLEGANGSMSATGGPGFLGTSKRVAYRGVLGEKDASGTLVLGSPTGRVMVVNSSTTNTKNVSGKFALPSSATTSTIFRVYRTAQFDSTIDPGDEMGLVLERYLTSAEVAARSVSFTDTTPDDFRGVNLYTNPNTGDGILQANDPPPLCKDLTYWNSRAWYANTKTKHRARLELLGVGSGTDGGTGIREGDVIVVNGRKYLAINGLDYFSGPPALPAGYAAQYPISVDTTAALSIAGTVRNLLSAVNNDTGNTAIDGIYVSGPNDTPGRIMFEARDYDAAQFTVAYENYPFPVSSLVRAGSTVTASTSLAHGLAVGDTVVIAATSPNANFPVGTKTIVTVPTSNSFTYTEAGTATTLSPATSYTSARATPLVSKAWNPEMQLNGVSTNAVTSDNDTAVNRLFYSKLQQPEAVPLLNYLSIGRKNKQILRVVPLRDKLFVFKQEGIFVVSGDSQFRVDELDLTVRLLAPDTVATVNNQIYCLTNKGVVSVSDGGVAIVSRAIEPDILSLNRNLANMMRYAFGVSYESEGLYLLWVPTTGTTCDKTFVFNTLGGTWSTWSKPATCAEVDPSIDALRIGNADTTLLGATTNLVFTERKTLTSADYVDYDQSINISNSSGFANKTLVTTVGAGILVGDSIHEGITGWEAIVTSYDSGTGVLTFDYPNGQDFGFSSSLTLNRAIDCTLTWAAQSSAAPGLEKQYREVDLHFRNATFVNSTLSFESDVVRTSSGTIEVLGRSSGVNAAVNFEDHPIPTHRRKGIPQEYRRCSYLQPTWHIREARAMWRLNGMTLVGEVQSERTNR